MERRFRQLIYKAAFATYKDSPACVSRLPLRVVTDAVSYSWSFGSNKLQLDADTKALQSLSSLVQADRVLSDHRISSRDPSANSNGMSCATLVRIG